MPAVDLSADAIRQRHAHEVAEEVAADVAGGEPGYQAPVRCSTAFIVAWIDGEVQVSADLSQEFVIEHYPTPDEVSGAGAVLYQDRGAEKTASLTAQTVEQRQQLRMAQIREQQLAAQAEFALQEEQRKRKTG